MKLATMARAGLAVLRGKTLGVRYPLFVIWAATSRCQARCTYCQIPERPARELTTEQVFSMIDQIAAMGTQRLGIWGGEPLLRRDIGDIVSYAHSRGLYTTLDTNGYLLPRKWDSLRDLDHLILSLDGDRAAHDANRAPGSFDQVMAALHSIPPGRTVWTITVLTKRNLEAVDWILDEADRLGFVATFQVLHHNDHMAGDVSHLQPSDAETRAVLRRLLAARKAGRRIGTSAACFEHLLAWDDFTQIARPERGRRGGCWAGKFYCNVDADGSLYPCSLRVGQQAAPNFLDGGFAAAYRSMTPIPCQSCLATCYTEYNLIFALHAPTILAWSLAMGRLAYRGAEAAAGAATDAAGGPDAGVGGAEGSCP